jgi:hypothetical protein
MSCDKWCVIREFPNYAGAEITKSLLEAAGVPVEIIPSDSITALYTGVRVLVKASLAHRARWVLSNADFSEAELVYMATGKLPSTKKSSDDSSH